MGNGEHLFRSNGTPSGAEDLGPVPGIRDITPVVDFNVSDDETGDRVYFVANDNTATPVLWRCDSFAGGNGPTQVLTAGGFPIKNPKHLRKLIGNGCWYLFFAADCTGTEYETITPARGNPFPAQSQVWYTGEFFDNNP
jgi:hypothetical protein